MSQYFTTVILSSVFGHRKPGPRSTWRARDRRSEPARAAYVGDNPSRDVIGAAG
jgi:HAD superfamily hydrolase (TIGR01549 family)